MLKSDDAAEILAVLDQHVVPRLEVALVSQIAALEEQMLASEQRVGSQLREAKFPVDEKTFVKLIKSMDTLLDRTTALSKRVAALEQRKAD